MRLTLHYQGPLPPKGNARKKHEVRMSIDPQLRTFWKKLEKSYANLRYTMRDPREEVIYAAGMPSLICRVGGFSFVPLVSTKFFSVADLKIFFLRHGPEGQLIHSGDMDNRLKTLFDGLSVPNERQIEKLGQQPQQGQDPVFCLLEDDALISDLQIETGECLDPNLPPGDVILLIRVTTRVTHFTEQNGWLA